MTQLKTFLRKLPVFGRTPKALPLPVADQDSPHAEAKRAPSPLRKRKGEALARKAAADKATPAPTAPRRMRAPAPQEAPPTRPDVQIPAAVDIMRTPVGIMPLRTAVDAKTPNTLDYLSIPCPDPTLEERTRDAHQNRALRMARQEDWAELSELIAEADRDRAMTPGGMCVAELLAFGARADVVLAVEHALLDSTPEDDAPMMCGIEALEYVLHEHPQDYVIGCIVAQAHIDLAWAWRGIGWDVEIAPRNREAFDAHIARAREIVASFDPNPAESTLFASTACALLRGDSFKTRTVADNYETLIDLNPRNTSPLRALGTHMLPRCYGSYAALELEARRTAARTQSIWGAGGYTWVMFDAISVDDEACARLDLEFFIEGLRDIVTRRPDPYTINLLAAYCANTMGQAFSGNDDADHIRAQITACAEWIVREHLTELHPMIWAHASQGFINNLRVGSASRFAAAGQDDAMRIICGIFKREIAEGKRIVFTDQGPIATAS